MDRGLWRVLRVYPARIIQVSLDEREFVGDFCADWDWRFCHAYLDTFQNGADPLFLWIIG